MKLQMKLLQKRHLVAIALIGMVISLPVFHFIVFDIPGHIEGKRYPATGFMPAEFLFLKSLGNFSLFVALISVILVIYGLIPKSQGRAFPCAFASLVVFSFFSLIYLFYIMMLLSRYLM